MVWFRVDDGLPTSRKVLRIPKRRRAAAIGVWTLAGAWSARELTDGHIPRYALDEIPSGAQYVPDLVSAGLWDATDDGWVFHDWAEYQPSKEDVIKERKAHAARQKAYRERRDAARDASRDAARDGGVTVPSVTVPRPDPTRPDPTVVPTELPIEDLPKPRTVHTYPADFEAFWDQYPKKHGKDAALKAWKSALKRASVEDILTGIKRFAAAPGDRKYIKDPSTWLNGGHWADEPEPHQIDPYLHHRRLG